MKTHFIEGEQYCYIGTKSCGCTVAACIDSPNHKKDTAKFVADCVKDGLTVERVSLNDAKCRLQKCEHSNNEKENTEMLF